MHHGAGQIHSVFETALTNHPLDLASKISFFPFVSDDREARLRMLGQDARERAHEMMESLAGDQVSHRENQRRLFGETKAATCGHAVLGKEKSGIDSVADREDLLWIRTQSKGAFAKSIGDCEHDVRPLQRPSNLASPHRISREIVQIVSTQRNGDGTLKSTPEKDRAPSVGIRKMRIDSIDGERAPKLASGAPTRGKEKETVQRLQDFREGKEARVKNLDAMPVLPARDLAAMRVASKAIGEWKPRNGREHDQRGVAGERSNSLLDKECMNRLRLVRIERAHHEDVHFAGLS